MSTIECEGYAMENSQELNKYGQSVTTRQLRKEIHEIFTNFQYLYLEKFFQINHVSNYFGIIFSNFTRILQFPPISQELNH